MKKTKTSEQYVGELRLCAIDLGFDPRESGNAIALPADFSSVGIDVGKDRWLIEGTREEMVAEILAAGYRIVGA